MTPTCHRSARCVLAAAFLLAMTSVAVFAQGTGEPPQNVALRIGPLFLNPTLALTNAGVDDNVFNDPTSAGPRSDYTLTLVPKIDLWVRFGPTWLRSSVREDLVYFQQFSSEQSANSYYTLDWTIPLNRLTFVPSGLYTNTRERPGFEIDTRAPRAEIGYGLLVDVRVLSKTTLSFRIDQHQTLFEQGVTFQTIVLHDELNRKETTGTVSVRHQVTPLTALSVDVSREQDRFLYQTLRDADATRIVGSIKFDPAALIKGAATFGYENYQPADPSVPGYTGTTAVVNLSYVLLGSTKFTGSLTRSVEYSYDINQPYYLQTAGSLEVDQQLFGPLDVVARGGLARLDYQNRIGAIIVVQDRVDHATSYGAGLGYHLGKDARIGFNVDRARRDSPIAIHQYTGLRWGLSVTLGKGSS